jgi:Sulfurtransferase TusA
LAQLFGLMIPPLTVPSDMNEANGDNTDQTPIDLHGLKCPLPALRTQKALSRLQAGATLARVPVKYDRFAVYLAF